MADGNTIRQRGSARAGRLSRSAEFQRVYRQGRSHANRQLVLYVFASQAGAGARLGLSVSRKVGGAVERNRVKRLLREAFAALAEELPAGHDLVLVARPAALELADRDGLTGMRAALAELLGKAGLAPREGEQLALAASARDAEPQNAEPHAQLEPEAHA